MARRIGSPRPRGVLDNDSFFKDFDRQFDKTQKNIFRAVGVAALIWLTFWIAVIAVAIHFLVKYW